MSSSEPEARAVHLRLRLEYHYVNKPMTSRQSKAAKREQRRARVAELYVQHLSQRQIAELLGVSQPTVSRDIKYILNQWRKQYVENIQQVRLRELAELDAIDREMAIQYQKTGEIKYVRERRWPKEMKAKILGLFEPERVALTDPQGNALTPFTQSSITIFVHGSQDDNGTGHQEE